MNFSELPNPIKWTGRYTRIQGQESAFHVGVDNTIVIKWTDTENDNRLTSQLVVNQDSLLLGSAVNRTKELYSGLRGGSFVINEFGQVITPVQNTFDRYWVGNMTGVPKFIDPRNNTQFDLNLSQNLQPGSFWHKPYIGMKYNLHTYDRIYSFETNDDGQRSVYLDPPYNELVESLRNVRQTGPARFIVNLHGLVLTKVDNKPVYICKLDYEKWFKKEDMS